MTNFDPEFTTEIPKDTPDVNPNLLKREKFADFTYVEGEQSQLVSAIDRNEEKSVEEEIFEDRSSL